MGASIAVHAPKILFDFFRDALYFLPWWYSKGLRMAAKATWRRWRVWERDLALVTWLRHFFKPVTVRARSRVGVVDIAVRSWGVVWRGAVLALWTGGAGIALVLYVVLPPWAVWQIIYQLL